MNRKKNIQLILIMMVTFLIPLNDVSAQTEECLICHSDSELNYQRGGRTVSLFVDEAAYSNSVHGGLDCSDCHPDFNAEEIPHRLGKEIYKVDCGECHSEYAQMEKNHIHYRLSKQIQNPPTCVTCHGKHEIKSPALVSNKVKEYCSQCHQQDNIILANAYHSKVESDETCYECHDTEDYASSLELSVHQQLNCADCHNFISNHLDNHPGNTGKNQKADCYICHNDIAVIHRESIHGISLREGIDEAAQCWDCHGSHKILQVSDSESPAYPTNIAKTCGSCHDDSEIIQKFDIAVNCPTQQYSSSVHGKLVSEGELGANCTSCHGVHDIKNRIQEGSQISLINIPETCGQCHAQITEEYTQSIHWIRAKKGIRNAPVCTDCHCEHGINAINSAEHKREEILKIQEETCYQCHQSPMMVSRGSEAGQVTNLYQDSYHGLAVLRGSENAAMCIDCHGVHKILPANDKESMVNKENVTATCQKCHPEATEVFSQSYSHVTQSETARRIESVVSNLYFWIIVLVIGGMIVHNLIIFVSEIRVKRKIEKNEITIPRFTKNEVIQHIFLLTSFIVLAITGFALKYPNSWWSEGLLSLGMTETIRQNIHRISAVVMISLGVYHVVYLLATHRGRDVLVNMLPKFEDLRHASETIMYYLRIKRDKPEYDKYNYIEKAEYWALIWGTIVMGVTGFILWFPTFVGEWAPIWLIKVSEIIHFYEAILASLAILIWHWFFVIFHPREYPMSFTWIDGQMSLQHYRHHHEKHFKKIILEWYNNKSGKIADGKLSHSTRLFTTALEKNGLDPDDIFQAEINNDYRLRAWLEEQTAEDQ